MNHPTRRPHLHWSLRLAVPVIALAALLLAGEPLPTPSGATLANACEPASSHAGGLDTLPTETARSDAQLAAERRNRMATRIRWSLTLPAMSRPLTRHSVS